MEGSQALPICPGKNNIQMKMSMEFGAMIRMEEKPRIWEKTAPVQLRPLENLAPNKIRSNPDISD